jgi:hypothetical protein
VRISRLSSDLRLLHRTLGTMMINGEVVGLKSFLDSSGREGVPSGRDRGENVTPGNGAFKREGVCQSSVINLCCLGRLLDGSSDVVLFRFCQTVLRAK